MRSCRSVSTGAPTGPGLGDWLPAGEHRGAQRRPTGSRSRWASVRTAVRTTVRLRQGEPRPYLRDLVTAAFLLVEDVAHVDRCDGGERAQEPVVDDDLADAAVDVVKHRLRGGGRLAAGRRFEESVDTGVHRVRGEVEPSPAGTGGQRCPRGYSHADVGR